MEAGVARCPSEADIIGHATMLPTWNINLTMWHNGSKRQNENCSCKDGTKFFFRENAVADWNQIYPTKQAFRLSCPPDAKACACVSPDECYESAPNVEYNVMSFVPFCKGKLCAIYMLFYGLPVEGEMVPIERYGKAFTVSSQFNPDNTIKPLPGDYKKITAASCGRCPVVDTCEDECDA
uniref:SCP domain-containing protein n=1 Tax=Steinernema glaseri TaxID=37863 RepID=A0A1I7Y8M0_9BILA